MGKKVSPLIIRSLLYNNYKNYYNFLYNEKLFYRKNIKIILDILYNLKNIKLYTELINCTFLCNLKYTIILFFNLIIFKNIMEFKNYCKNKNFIFIINKFLKFFKYIYFFILIKIYVYKLYIKENFGIIFNCIILFKCIENPFNSLLFILKYIEFHIKNNISFKFIFNNLNTLIINFGIKLYGIKIIFSGRINGVNIATSEKYIKGSIPVHVFNYNIQYSMLNINTKYGIINTKLWIIY